LVRNFKELVTFGEVVYPKVPKFYYNVQTDMDNVPAPIHPATKQELGVSDFEPLFTKECAKQEFSKKRFIRIPEQVREAYQKYRPSPLIRATNLEKYLKTKSKIYFKFEGASPTGSHKLNTALAQAYYASKEGLKGLTTETGAGQWGTALSYACKKFGLECLAFMVRSSYDNKPHRKTIINLYDGRVVPSPSDITEYGRSVLKSDPDTPGSLGIAISEAIEVAMKNPEMKYSLGSVLNHVLMHQSIIGLESKEQMKRFNDFPDIVIGCVGGGSNFGGIAFPYYNDKVRLLAVEPEVSPSLTKGEYRYDFGDTAKMTPMLKMYTLGCGYISKPIHAEGLRYHGAAPLLSLMKNQERVESVCYPEDNVLEAAKIFIKTEGIVPAPESSHAVRAAIDEAKKGTKTVLFNMSGHGLLDLKGYEKGNGTKR
jgi:tryptophan synthase beta chain